MTNKPSKKHYIEWLALKTIIAYIRSGTITATQTKVKRLVPVLQKILKSEFRWANRNLQMIYGNSLSEKQRQVLVKIVFENVLFSHVEGMQVGDIKFQEIGTEHIHDALKLDRGVIACSIHLGSWEPGLKRFAELVAPTPAAIVYRHANNPLSEAEFIKIRAPYGVEWIRRDQPRDILKAIKEKKVLGLMTDINTREGGVTAPFLGIPAQCPPGPARLALGLGAPIVPIYAVRDTPGEARLFALPAIEPQKKRGASEEDVAALTTEINTTFAPVIHNYAEQYNWLHARWRARSSGELWRADTTLEVMNNAKVDPSLPPPHLGERVFTLINERL
ncbi:MAG: lysophospholipid acyltransferase family protein [Magnetococcales bacterium]|nr:lysophospholipid acyltransferase family protein [Magnetococcales bacterium]